MKKISKKPFQFAFGIFSLVSAVVIPNPILYFFFGYAMGDVFFVIED